MSAVPRITEICRLYNGNSFILPLQTYLLQPDSIQRIKESKVAAKMNPKIANQIIAAVDAGSPLVRSLSSR